VELRKGTGRLRVELPGVADIAPTGPGTMFAITGGGEGETAGMLFHVKKWELHPLANLMAFEAEINPDGGAIDSNPFDVAALSRTQALVADAGGNSILIADMNGNIDWVATLPSQLGSTENIKQLLSCPDAPPDLAFVCDLPEMIPAEPVPSSVAVGPDGAYYVGELTGFPGTKGISRIWRIEPGTLHAQCGSDPACTVVADGFTSVVDLNFGPDGTLYVTEIDEASFMAVELAGFGLFVMEGGTVNTCDSATWDCSILAGGLMIPIATTVGTDGMVYAAVNALMPDGQVISLAPAP